MDTKEALAALDGAIRAEENARSFYRSAADRTSDPAGASMFRELADFEEHHRERLVALRTSLAGDGKWIPYAGRDLSAGASTEARGRSVAGPSTDALEALQIAIQAEERAEAEYKALAEKTRDADGKRMFERLASEEAMHRRVLDDQYYSLTNRGVWVWGD